MSAAVKFQSYVEKLSEGGIDQSGHTLKLALCATAPDAATDVAIGDITEIAAGNGYTAGGITITPASSSQTSGTYTLVIADVAAAWTATPAAMATFRYLVLYDSTSGNLIQYWDHGSNITLAAGDTLNLNFAATTISLT